MKRKKQIIKRIGAFLCALVVSLSCIGSMPFYAADTSGEVLFDAYKDRYTYEHNSEIDLSKLPTDDTYCHYVIVKYVNSDTYYCFVSNKTSFKLDVSSDSISKKAIWKYFFSGYVGYSSKDLVNWTRSSSSSTGFYWAYIYKDSGDDAINGQYMQYVASDIPIYAGSLQIEFNTKVETYVSSLGYLQNLVTRTTWLTDSKGNADYNTTRTSVAFDLTTTTGIDLTSGDYVVRMYGQRAYFKNNFNDGFKDSYSGDILFDDDFPLVYFGEFDASSGKFVYDDDDLYSLIDVVDTEKYSGWDLFVNQIHQGCIRYYQVYNTKTGEYGGYVRVINEGKDIQTTVRDDLSVDNDGFVDKDLNHSIGSGTTYEDAELNADKYQENIGDGNFSSLEGAVNSFTSTLGVVPRAIGSVFSFLPTWCHDYIGLCFGLLVALVVWKFIRG